MREERESKGLFDHCTVRLTLLPSLFLPLSPSLPLSLPPSLSLGMAAVALRGAARRASSLLLRDVRCSSALAKGEPTFNQSVEMYFDEVSAGGGGRTSEGE